MAHLNGTFFSTSLVRPVHYTAVLCNDIQQPTADNPHFKRPTKSVYLLHGYSGFDTDWFSNAPLGDLANTYNVNFFMPSGENSFYLDRPETGGKYAQFVGKEFIEYTTKTFGLSGKREDIIIGGLSMGGFGALHTALMFPETFSACLALSSALIVNGIKHMTPGNDNPVANYDYYRLMFGDLEKLETSDNNPEVLARKLVEKGTDIPKIYMAVGTEDFLLEPNREFKKFLEDTGIPVEYFEGPGIHDFVFWRAQLKAGLEWALKA